MVKNKIVKSKVNRRKQILEAAEEVLLSDGLSGVTTRQISRAAGCSEGALYVHFASRLELLLAMLEERLPVLLEPLQALQQSIGSGSPHSNLASALEGIFRFHQRVLPLVAGLFADPALHAAYRESLARQGKGPQLSLKVLEDYIAAEQKLGRLDNQVDAKIAAHLLMSASFLSVFNEQFFRMRMRQKWPAFVRQVITVIVPDTGCSN